MTSRPNIILIMCDDLGYGDTGFNGNRVIQTPHLDAMAAAGGRFTRFYAGGPVCSPTRGTCLTGRHYWRYGIDHANVGRLPAEEHSIQRALKQAGYRTGHFGKWHLGTLDREHSGKPNRDPAVNYAPPWERDFDESYCTEFRVPTWDPGLGFSDGDFSRSDEPWGSPYFHNGAQVTDTPRGCDSKLIVDRAIPFIRDAVAAETPFLSVVWFHAPHTPVVAGPDYLAMYADHDEDAAHYYGCVTAMDEQIGRLMAELEALGIHDDSIVFFCSDNGPEGHHELAPHFRRCHGVTGGLRGRKRSLYDGGVGVPACVSWPGVVAPGAVFTAPCSTLDYLPTILAACGLDMPDTRPLDGQDIRPILSGETDRRGSHIPFHFLETTYNMFGAPTLALIGDQYKLLTHLIDNGASDQLYDLLADREEQTDLMRVRGVDRQPYDDVAMAMRDELKAFYRSCEASHRGDDYPEPYDPTAPMQAMLSHGWWQV